MSKRIAALICACVLLLCACTPTVDDSSLPSENSLQSDAAAVQSDDSSDMEESIMSTEESIPEPQKKVLDGSKLVVFGDSITALGSWGESVAEQLNMYFFNGAMGGITTKQGLDRFAAFAANRQPDFVTLCFGMNDLIMTAKDTPRVTPEQFKENLTKMVELVREVDAVPIICTTNPLVNEVFFASQGQDPSWYTNVGTPLEWLDVYNAAAREVAMQTGCLLADVRAACDSYEPKEINVADGIHLGDLGNSIFAKTVADCLLGEFERDYSVGEVERNPCTVLREGSASLISLEADDWYTLEKRTMSIRERDGALKLSNTNGLWPDAQYVPSVPVAADPEKTVLRVKLTTTGAGSSIVIYLNHATPSAYTDNRYFVLNPLLGVECDPVSGDIKPNQSCDVTIKLSDLKLSESCYNEDGLIVFSGIKIYVAGEAFCPVTVSWLELAVEE